MKRSFSTELLSRKFFSRHPILVAENLLGKVLVRVIKDKKSFYKIIETEAYSDDGDDACHYVRYGKTKRTERLADIVGKSYIYSVHVNMYCFNFVAHKKGCAGGVLVRGIEKIEVGDKENKVFLGPAKSCRELKIDRRYDGIDMLNNKEFYVVKGFKVKKSEIVRTKRINIDYAKNAKDWLWRYVVPPAKAEY